jgi:hypothetical protein
MRINAARFDWRALTRLDREALNFIIQKMQERYGTALTLLEIEEAILDAFGMHVRLATRGRELGVITLAFSDIGVPEQSARAQNVRPPRMDLLPKETTDKIAAAFARARETLPRFGVKVTARSLVWVPLPEWEACRQEIAAIREELSQIVSRELLDPYRDIRESWREKAAQKAAESYQSLVDAGVEIRGERSEFIARYIDRVLAAFPSYSQLQNGIDLACETVRPSPADLVSSVIAFRDEYLAEQARALDLEAAKQAERLARRKMMQERAEIWRAQAEQASLLGEMAREAGMEILKITLPIGEGLESLTPGASRKLRNAIGRWLETTGALLSTTELDDRMRLVLQELDQPAKKRSRERLVRVLAELSEELVRIGQPHPLYTSAGAGVLDLQEVQP